MIDSSQSGSQKGRLVAACDEYRALCAMWDATESNHDFFTAAYRCPECDGVLLSTSVGAGDDAPCCEAGWEDCDGMPLVEMPVLKALSS